jgi:hypothetical protein
VILFFTDGQPNTVTMPRVLMSPSGGCTNKGNRFAIIATNGGMFTGQSPGAPPVAADSALIASRSGCAFDPSGQVSGVANEATALTRATSDGNAGDSTGDDGYSQGGDSNGHGTGPYGSGQRWDNWPGDQDAFGNSLFGYKSTSTDGSGRITVDSNSILSAGVNALANAATRVRADSLGRGLDVVTYVIGLGNFTGAPELELLNRVANTPDSPVYDGTQPVGLMIYATDAGQLEAAFSQVGSEMLRLAM